MRHDLTVSKRRRAREGTVFLGNLWGRNFGDDAMLGGVLSLERGPSVVLCQKNSEALAARGIAARELSIGALWRAARKAKAVAVAGGTHLQYLRDAPAVGQLRVVASWLVVTVMVRLAGARMEMRSVGLGPFESGLARAVARVVCRMQSSISVRDGVSASLLEKWRIPHTRVEDLALPFVRSWLPVHGRDSFEPPMVLAAPAYARCSPVWWADTLRRTLAATNAESLVFLASARQGGGSDEEVVARIRELLPEWAERTSEVHYSGDPEQALALIDRATTVVAARYHVALCARALGRPVVIDRYHPKLDDASRQASLREGRA